MRAESPRAELLATEEAVLGGCLEEVCLCNTSIGKMRHKATMSSPSQFRPPKRSPSGSPEAVNVASHGVKGSLLVGVSWGHLDGQIILGHAGGSSVMMRVLQRGVQEGQGQRRQGEDRNRLEQSHD